MRLSDTHTKLLIQEGIEKLLKGRTSFVVAHWLSTKVDRIFVIDKGGVLEQGNARELMEKKGEYYKLYMDSSIICPHSKKNCETAKLRNCENAKLRKLQNRVSASRNLWYNTSYEIKYRRKA